MKQIAFVLLVLIGISCGSTKKQKTTTTEAKIDGPKLANTLLWKVSGNGLQAPNYLYGTMHIMCAEEVNISDSFKHALNTVDKIYFELDMNNMAGMLSAMPKMMMKGDTTLKMLLKEEDYKLVKEYLKKSSGGLPTEMFEKMQPLLVSSLFSKDYMDCKSEISGVEMKIMEYNKKNKKKKIGGLEEIMDQINAFGKISYKEQAKMMIKELQDTASSKKQMQEMKTYYLEQNLEKLSKLMNSSDDTVMDYEDDLLTTRNKNWIKKFKELFPKESIVAAVGAAHLIGKNGIIQLLRNEGYTVEPVMQ